MCRACGTYEGEEGCTKRFATKTGGTKALGKPRRRGKDSINPLVPSDVYIRRTA